MRRLGGPGAVAAVLLGSVVLAACGRPSSTGMGNPGHARASASAFKACMVTDIGGIDDKSFNASAWAGMQAAQKHGKAAVRFLQSDTATDYVPNIDALVAQKCSIVVTVGGLMRDQTQAAARKTTGQRFGIVDASYDPPLPNVFGMEFNTAQGAFLGGYLAAGMSASGKVATYGGLQIAPVTIYMDGFSEGIAYYNKRKHKNVQLLGWDEATQKGTFAGSFTDQAKGSQITTDLVRQGADVVFPVAGGTGLGTASAAQASAGRLSVIWVDVDGCESAAQYCSAFLSTVYKNIPDAVQKGVEDASGGRLRGGSSIGTLKNGGTGLSPFHFYENKVPTELKTELKQVQSDIESGKIAIESKAQPTSG